MARVRGGMPVEKRVQGKLEERQVAEGTSGHNFGRGGDSRSKLNRVENEKLKKKSVSPSSKGENPNRGRI